MRLSEESVEKLMEATMFHGQDAFDMAPPENIVFVEAIQFRMAFRKDALEAHKGEIISLLGLLDHRFRKGKTGGWSFVNMRLASDERRWGDYYHAESLLCLGMAIGKAGFCTENREFWKVLPQEAPYIYVDIPECFEPK